MKNYIFNGELFNKIIVLKVKPGKIIAAANQANLQREFNSLSRLMLRAGITCNWSEFRDSAILKLSIGGYLIGT